MPASRSARAMTFAPRSWPSSPGLAMTTLSRRTIALSSLDLGPQSLALIPGPRPCPCPRVLAPCPLNNRNFLVFAPGLAQRVAHFSQRRIGAYGLENRRHQILRGSGRLPQAVQRLADAGSVARPAQAVQLGQLRFGGRFVD